MQSKRVCKLLGNFEYSEQSQCSQHTYAERAAVHEVVEDLERAAHDHLAIVFNSVLKSAYLRDSQIC